MYFDGRYKIAVYHNSEVSELYDLETDPNEYDNLWNKPEYKELQADLVLKCFKRAIEGNLDYVLGNSGTF